VQVVQQANCYPMIPAGLGHHEMMLSDTEWYSDAV
jgi:acetolactate synthase-1/2/3 large subunit